PRRCSNRPRQRCFSRRRKRRWRCRWGRYHGRRRDRPSRRCGQWILRHRRSGNRNIGWFRHQWGRGGWRLRGGWPRRKIDENGIVLLRRGGVATAGGKSNPDSFFLWFARFSHGHFDRWKNESVRNFAVCHPSIDARTIKTHTTPGGLSHGHPESLV